MFSCLQSRRRAPAFLLVFAFCDIFKKDKEREKEDTVRVNRANLIKALAILGNNIDSLKFLKKRLQNEGKFKLVHELLVILDKLEKIKRELKEEIRKEKNDNKK